MKVCTSIEPQIATQISAVREFNRFYTAKLGLLRRRHLDGEFSLTEARILYEIGANPKMTASTLCRTLEALVTSLTRVRSILSGQAKTSVRIVRLTVVDDNGLVMLQEYYEAQSASSSDKTIDRILAADDRRRLWLPYAKTKAATRAWPLPAR